MQAAFVIHIHTGYGSEHYDLMLDLQPNRPLTTWQLAASPIGLEAGQAVQARRIQDHRREYLVYEGQVSNGRGEIRRLDSGSCQVLEKREDYLRLKLSGERLNGQFELRLLDDSRGVWTIARTSTASG